MPEQLLPLQYHVLYAIAHAASIAPDVMGLLVAASP